jgi:hypothetical protein
MATELQQLKQEIYRAHQDLQSRHTYFLLTAAGAGIALAVNQTQGAALSWLQTPLGLAVFCWGLSFFCGCRHLEYVSSTLFANLELFRVQSGIHPKVGVHPESIQAASEGILSAAESNSNSANTFANWQFRLLVAGGLLYVIWHVVEMYHRRLASAWL